MVHFFDYTSFFDSSGAGEARWFDQKVTFDVLSTVAGAVQSFVSLDGDVEFSRFDIEKVRSFSQIVERDYGKPSLQNESARNEYDKFIAQNLNLLAYAGVLHSRSGRPRMYNVADSTLLNRIAANEQESRFFLIAYIEWALRGFGWWTHIEEYVDSEHTAEDMSFLKTNFTRLLMDTTGLGQRSTAPHVESNRIFAKVINLIAYAEMVPGVERGKVMDSPPSKFDLSYNRPNWRDAASGKPKRLTRREYEVSLENMSQAAVPQRNVSAEMRNVKRYHDGVSEVPDHTGVLASHVHHIFPKSLFPDLADIRENLVVLTPGQHLGLAHPDGNTNRVDPIFQRTCLERKLASVKASVDLGDGIYSYSRFRDVLVAGWQLPEPAELSYEELRRSIIRHVV